MTNSDQTHHVDLVEWCHEQRANALKNIEIIDRGRFKIGTDEPESAIKDETPDLRATYARIYEQMDHLLEKYRSPQAQRTPALREARSCPWAK